MSAKQFKVQHRHATRRASIERLEPRRFLSASLWAIGHQNDVYQIDAATGSTIQTQLNDASTLLALAEANSGTLYAVTQLGSVGQINLSTGAFANVGYTNAATTGFAFPPNGTAYPLDVAYLLTNYGLLSTFNINTGVGSEVGSLPSSITPVSGMVFCGNDDLYITAESEYPLEGSDLVEVNPYTAAATDLGFIGDFGPITGLAVGSDGTLYGVTAESQQVISIDVNSGAGTPVSTFTANNPPIYIQAVGSLPVEEGTLPPSSVPPPAVAAPANQTAVAGSAQTFSLGSFTASNPAAPYSASVNWGDGSNASTFTIANAGTIPAQSHTYSAVGSDTVSVVVTDAAGHASDAETFNVTVGTAPAGTAGLALSVAKSTLPSSAISGVKLKGSVVVRVANATGATIKGTGSLDLYSDDASGGSTLVGSIRRGLNLKEGKSTTVSIPVSTAFAQAGAYTLLPQIAVGGDTSFASSGPTINVAAAYVALSAAAGAVTPAAIAIKKSGSVTVTIANLGNLSASGSLVITLGLSSDGVTPLAGVTLTSNARRVTIKPGKSGRYVMHFKVPATLAAALYYPFVSVSLDDITATAVGVKAFTAK